MAKGKPATKAPEPETKTASLKQKEKPVAKLGAGAAAALKETRLSAPSNGKQTKKPSKPSKSTEEEEEEDDDVEDAPEFVDEDDDVDEDGADEDAEDDGDDVDVDGDEEEADDDDDGEEKGPAVSFEQTEEQKKLVLDGMALLQSMDQHDATEVTFDLGNLAAFNTHTVDKHAYSQNPKEYLETISRDNVQLLINRLFSQPTQPTPPDINGRLVAIPPPTVQLPREKPLPKAKPPTKWEQFAKLKGIQKRKRGRMLWDEEKQQYLPRYGYNKANDDSSTWAIEAKGGEDTSVDPWTRLANEKKERIAKNKKQQEKNVKAAEGNRLPGTLDLTAIMPEKGVKRNQIGKEKKQRHVDIALEQAQRSTASMGKFDDVRHNEPSRKTEKAPKRDAEFARDIKAERAHNLAILNKVVHNDESENFNLTRAVNANQQQKESRKRARKERGGDEDGDDNERPRGKISKGKMNRAKSQGRKEDKGAGAGGKKNKKVKTKK